MILILLPWHQVDTTWMTKSSKLLNLWPRCSNPTEISIQGLQSVQLMTNSLDYQSTCH